ncbi:putative F-box protein At1g67623 [Rutidosis leptorrhynchoides]|uniref:putative F-box protein At1g67623 n=1 Tax=Rutidosis leptorrhynchoides TaxID=125765 RepID=UPI003A9A2070
MASRDVNCTSSSSIGNRKCKLMKRRRARRQRRRPVVGSLPGDLLIDVLTRVASSSFTDLFNAKLSCRDFLGAAEDESIFQHVSIDKFPVIHWFPPSDELLSFLNRCIDKGNPEAMFRQGMIEFFSRARTETGLEYLKRASEKGHVEATYVYGMILLSRGGQSSQQGLNILNSMKISRSKYLKICECRAKIKAVIREMWINNSISLNEVGCKCPERNNVYIRKRKFEEEEDVDVLSCDACGWYREVISFCKIVDGVV